MLRAIRDDNEIYKWSLFCEQTFAYKLPNPPKQEYFLRHYVNDPNKHLSHIRIATTNHNNNSDTNNDTIVASCRIFHRSINFPFIFDRNDIEKNVLKDELSKSKLTTDTTKVLIAGGIGEVCTMESHRYRGLAKELLKDAIECMEMKQDTISTCSIGDDTSPTTFLLSFLHASPTFFPVYEKVGYKSTVSYWSVITIDWKELILASKMSYHDIAETNKINDFDDTGRLNTTVTRQYNIRRVHFPNDIHQLMSIHQNYSEQRFIGCIVRSYEYWDQYVALESQHYPIYVLEENIIDHNTSDTSISSSDPITKTKIIGWMSLQYRGQQQRYQLREFGCHDIKHVHHVFKLLLAHCYQMINGESIDPCCATATKDEIKSTYWKLHLPTPILNDVIQQISPITNREIIGNSMENTTGPRNVDNDYENSNDKTFIENKGMHGSAYICDIISENDYGWMYRPIGRVQSSNLLDLWSNVMLDIQQLYEHLIWPSDSF